MANFEASPAMRLKVMLPGEVLLRCDVTRIVGRAPNGSFGMLPRHIDFVIALTPGVLCFTDTEDREFFLGHDEGILVKQGKEVLVSVRRAVEGRTLSELRSRVKKQFVSLEAHERAARSALARLEAGVVRRFIELGEQH